ncbi:TylF/MycF/NovP-related O-methyltransferase [Thermomonas sp.]|uniref:TylF/MycF/NovP-related O-methyltransferase n=1 Tax=Thermomonas sp. TaxID=1971895 RepID=UPI00262B7324|nr:TylF/MycF/NovP-related O-methyltransferase [Thermomonas sp.]
MQGLRNWLKDRIPDSTLEQMVRRINRHSGNWLNRPLYGRARYNEDGLVSAHYPSFEDDKLFLEAYAAGQDTGSWPHGDLRWRAHVVCWAAARGAALPGDFVECGVNRGGYAMSVIHYTDFPKLGKRFFLLDTFEGLVESQLTDGERQAGLRGGGYVPCHEAVQRTFAPFTDQVRIIRGTVPDTLDQVDATRIAFLSIDMNATAPEIATAERFWDRLSPGAAMVLDDYGWRKHGAQRLAFDAFAREHDVPLLALPTGQGLILKP